MTEFANKLIELKRDLTGLWGLLCDLSDAVDHGTGINEAELFILSEIAHRDFEAIEDMIQSVNSINYNRDENQKALNKIFDNLPPISRAKLIIYADKLEKGEIDITA